MRSIEAVVQAQVQAAAPRPSGGRVRCVLVGFGRRGLDLARAAAGVPQISIVAVADAYEGRLQRAREVLGSSIVTGRDGSEVIRSVEADAVLIATPDHLHAKHAADARTASKPAWCEHPLCHDPRDLGGVRSGLAAGALLPGPGSLPDPVVAAARELIAEHRIGRVTLVSGTWDSGTALDAWALPFPPDSSPDSIAWSAFAPGEAAFDPAHFFRWPLYNAYGSGVVGARFVPQLWDIHRILGLAEMPARCAATGRLARWKDGRDAPDVVEATFEYSNVVVTLGATLNGSGRPRQIRLIGTEGTLVLERDGIELVPQALDEPYAQLGDTWSDEYRRWFYMMHGLTAQGDLRGTPPLAKRTERYTLPEAGHPLAPSLGAFLESVRAGGAADADTADAAAGVTGAGLMCAAALNAGRVVKAEEVLVP